MKKARPIFAVRLWRRVAPTNAAHALALCVLFALVIGIGIYRGWHPWSAASPQPSALSVALAPVNPAALFIETRVGELVFWSEAGDHCRRAQFDNRTGTLRPAGYIPCIQTQPSAESPQAIDRLAAMRKTFQK